MSDALREDFLSSMRSVVVRTLVIHNGGNERSATQLAEQILLAVQRSFGGERAYIPLPPRLDEAALLREWRGDNRAELCRKYGISRSWFYTLLARAQVNHPDVHYPDALITPEDDSPENYG